MGVNVLVLLLVWLAAARRGGGDRGGGGVHYKFGHIWSLVTAMTSCAVAADVTAVFRRSAE